MPTILITYATDYGSTKKAAEAIAEGVATVDGAEAVVKDAESVTAEDFIAADGIIFGSPVHMGSPDWRIKRLIDTVCGKLWMEGKLIGKVGGVFATGSGFGRTGGGAELTMLAMLNNLAELGLVLVPLPSKTPGYALGGLQWGPYLRTLNDEFKAAELMPAHFEAMHHHGANIARVAAAIAGQTIFAR